MIHKNIKKKFYSYDDCNFKDLPFFCSQHYLTADSIYAKLSIPMVSARERRWNCCSRVTSWENPTFRVVKTQLFRVTLQLLHIVESVHRDLGFELWRQPTNLQIPVSPTHGSTCIRLKLGLQIRCFHRFRLASITDTTSPSFLNIFFLWFG